eukprot:TRINITY_DN14060_c0_g1_i1.p1 TRINITY_DN14060_c0_g1~~TRINITY_DN14060_c0_g1_i1.p1  ORF type:complete len:323 (-),score=34.06 TRINITY_DN14060_c0_g1_i1:166-1068(-)
MGHPLLFAEQDVDFPAAQLWNFYRLKSNLSVLWWIALLLWTPFGISLIAFRIVFFAVAATLYPFAYYLGIGNLYSRIVLPILSFWVTVRGRENLRNSSAAIVVSNHVSDFDACSLWALDQPAAWTLVMNEHWRKVVTFVQRVGWPFVVIFTSGDNTKEKIKNEINTSEDCPKRHILFFPEGATCSGVAVMQFNWFIFGVGEPLIPCTIKLVNPWPIQMQMNGVSVLHNILALFFVPCVFYEVTILPEMAHQGSNKEDFAKEVRMQVCKHLGVPGTVRALRDKQAYSKTRREAAAMKKKCK